MPLTLLLLALLSACAEEEEAAPVAGCRSDLECPDGQLCGSDGRCSPTNGGGGSGGGAGVTCVTSEDCLTAPFSSVPYFFWDGAPGEQPVCTAPPVRCPGTEPCPTPQLCAPIANEAGRPGGAACEADEECWSGRCLPHGDGKLCLRTCGSDADCPAIEHGERFVGLRCAEETIDNVRFRRCVPHGDDPRASLCRTDADCPEGRACRFDGEVYWGPRAVPLCLPRPEGGGREPGAFCPGAAEGVPDPSACHAGICMEPCVAMNSEPGAQSFCESDTYRCSAPCLVDADCPRRLVCQTGEWQNRVGDWDDLGLGAPRTGREIRYCVLPPGGCRDEVDCCPSLRDGECFGGWSAEQQRCTITLRPPADSPHLVTLCESPDGRATPGACCASHADCDADLCVPARVGTECEGGGVCSTPCDPDPGPDLQPGTGDERDRCAERAPPGSYHAASRCLPLDTQLHGAGLTLAATLNVCR